MITYLFFYHDTTYLNVDRAEMNRKLFAALKPGGLLVIADHSAKAGAMSRSARPCIASSAFKAELAQQELGAQLDTSSAPRRRYGRPYQSA